MAPETNISLTVVVSGSPQHVSVNAHQKVEELIRKALHEAGISHGDIDGWTLRTENGGTISPSERIGEAGIRSGATLFLDPDEGGGGEVFAPAAQMEEPPPPPVLVDPAICESKLREQLRDWDENSSVYSKRGWTMLGTDGLHVDVAFSARLPLGPFQDMVVTPLAVRIGFENYDVWAPSIRVIDPITRRWLGVPRLRAPDFANTDAAGNALDLFIDGHPETNRVFLCTPGVREYHTHPEHSGDDWLLYRGRGYGTLGQLCELLWRLTTRSVTGFNLIAQRISVGENAASVNQNFEIRQEDVDALTSQVQSQLGQVPPGNMAPEIQEQLQAFLANQQE